MKQPRGLLVFLVALVSRVLVAVWGSGLFPPSEDGAYYHQLAKRIANGQGYTWLWPDGAVTYAAHYPVGYPAILALSYRLFGASGFVAMMVNAILGALGAYAIFQIVRRNAPKSIATGAGLAVALHPALLPYTAAVMTEGVAASLLAIAIWLLLDETSPAWRRWLLGGVVLGLTVLVRPQLVLIAPLVGALSVNSISRDSRQGWGAIRARVAGAIAVTSIAVAVCLPWTVRNCVRMDRCALVSVNAGWNLLIGAQTNSGAWSPIVTPPECRNVWLEAAKDICFERAGRREIQEQPLAWFRKIPTKWAVTFDYFGAAPWYLHSANPSAFSDRAKKLLGAFETIVARGFLVAALLHLGRAMRIRLNRYICYLAVLFALLEHAWPGYFILAGAVFALDREVREKSPIWVVSAVVIATTALTHAVFFGAGRYGLVMVPFVAAIALVPLPDAKSARRLPIRDDERMIRASVRSR